MNRFLGVIAVAFILSFVPVFGQGGVAELNGIALDQSGAILPGVTLTVTNETTGLVRTVVSNDTGRFVLPALQPGRYTMTAELTGFQTQTRTGLVLAVGQAVTLNFTLPVGTLTDQVIVTGDAPLVEPTTTQLGTEMRQRDIETMPIQGRQQYALLSLVPGVTPNLAPGTAQGTQYVANGRDASGNLYLIDGAYNNDDRSRSGGGQVGEVTVDSTAEFQVLVHEYGAEYGGAAGIIVNAVTKSGTNEFHGRAFGYYEDAKLNATNYFLKLAGKPNPASGNRTYGADIGGPIFKNKAFFFFNYQHAELDSAANLIFPPEAAPLAVSYSTLTKIRDTNYFTRVDYQASRNHNLSFRYIVGPQTTIGDTLQTNKSTFENAIDEAKPFAGLFNGQWTAVLGNHVVNEMRMVRVGKNYANGDRSLFGPGSLTTLPNVALLSGGQFLGLRGRDQLDVGSSQAHPDYSAGPYPSIGGWTQKDYSFSELFNYTPGKHTLKLGFGASKNGGTNIRGDNYFGTFSFGGNRPFDPADASTYPIRFQIRLGQFLAPDPDHRIDYFASDKWQATRNLTLSLGVRYDYQHIVPASKNAFAPRIGVAYAPSDKTVIRGGFGKFYEYQAVTLASNKYVAQVISPSFLFDTGQDNSALQGTFPSNPCLRPGGLNGQAVIGAACRAQLVTTRDQVAAGSFVNTEPILDGNHKLGYLLATTVGLQRELLPGLGVTVDFVSQLGRDQTARVDINEPRLLSPGAACYTALCASSSDYGRPGVAIFDPTGTLIPASARSASFQRVLQYRTSPLFNTNYKGLEMGLTKRLANRWAGRFGYTLSRSRGIGTTIETRVVDDLNPRSDYSLANLNNVHSVTAGASWEALPRLEIGPTFRYYSGNPVNETVGLDVNKDRDNTDRPVHGVNDLTMPILSPIGANGVAVRNGMPGSNSMFVDFHLAYGLQLRGTRTMDFTWEMYNVTNRVNFGNPVGNRLSPNFGKPITAGLPRSMQLGARFRF
ncbi:MAG TPA: TonB-dependent receptor [Vicinamibacterales bacterium]|nr:TonB-dependent receptor [Vicinamibacterales bacterium]